MGKTEPVALGSGETEPTASRSGEMEPAALGSGETFEYVSSHLGKSVWVLTYLLWVSLISIPDKYIDYLL